ncbi:uncharacterized protein LOC143445012 [Clavelina lepadiformis]|uniref:uncharacterized protein LOC143445012 n=1 Tax=Clavelina lepadiformis TaxID=159417 RepID=UPI00404109B5
MNEPTAIIQVQLERKPVDNTLKSKENVGPVKEITVQEVGRAMYKTKIGKASGPSCVPIEAIRLCNVESILAKIGNGMMNGEGMPASWRKSVLVPLYKGKGDVKEYTSYRSLKMLEHAMKVLERVFEERIRERVEISEIQMGFMPGKGTMDAMFAAFDRVPREVIWWALRKKGVMEPEVRAVMEMYKEAETSVKLEGEMSEWFKVVGDNWKGVEEKFVRWKNALESKGLKVNINKTKVIRIGTKSSRRVVSINGRLTSGMNYECGRCKGCISDEEEEKYVKLESDEIELIKEFRYLGDMIGEDDSTGKAVTARIRAS